MHSRKDFSAITDQLRQCAFVDFVRWRAWKIAGAWEAEMQAGDEMIAPRWAGRGQTESEALANAADDALYYFTEPKGVPDARRDGQP